MRIRGSQNAESKPDSEGPFSLTRNDVCGYFAYVQLSPLRYVMQLNSLAHQMKKLSAKAIGFREFPKCSK
jgi:hypothetical protein